MRTLFTTLKDFTCFITEVTAMFYRDMVESTGIVGRLLVNALVGLTIIAVVGVDYLLIDNYAELVNSRRLLEVAVVWLPLNFLIGCKIYSMLKALETSE